MLVVGDAAVGKTTLLRFFSFFSSSSNNSFLDLFYLFYFFRALRGEREVKTKIVTDGIEIGKLDLEGITLNCWDFAGQEVYIY